MATHILKILQCEQSYQVYRVTLNKNIDIDFQKFMTTKFLWGDKIPYFISMSKFGRFKNYFVKQFCKE